MTIPDRSGASGLLLGAMAGCTATAAVVVVLAEDARWLRLGVVAALWAALAGAFAAARYRGAAASGAERLGELRRTYQMELEREVAARREYELELAADLRSRIEAEVRAEGGLAGVRAELRNLRESLQALLGGEVLVQRVALRAQATRFPGLSDQSRVLGGEPTAAEPAPVVAPYPVAPWPLEPTRTPAWDGEAATEVLWPSRGAHRAAPETVQQPPRQPAQQRGQVTATAMLGGDGNGSRHRPAAGDAPPIEAAEPVGAHASGLSVSALLAAHGSGGPGGRRRRAD